MKKKIIFGSIGAAVIIVLATFTSVVGLQSNGSSMRESPLFSIRTDSSINENSKQLPTSSYVGKGKIMNSVPMLQDRFKYIMGLDITYTEIKDIVNNYLNSKNQFSKSEINYLLHLLDLSSEEIDDLNPEYDTSPRDSTCIGETCDFACGLCSLLTALYALFSVIFLTIPLIYSIAKDCFPTT